MMHGQKNIKIWNTFRSICNVPDIFCPNLTTFGFSRQILIKILNIKFHEIPSTVSRNDIRTEDQRTDGRTWRN